jgi:hypothetical protein
LEVLGDDDPAQVRPRPVLALGELIDLGPQVLAEFDRDQMTRAFRSLHTREVEQALHALQAKCE